ncbi:MAG TPA: DUF3105 domain-containing protein [Herpetosiphonaceae bacterium]
MATRQRGTPRPDPTLRGREVPQKRAFPLVPILIAVGALIAVGIGAWVIFGGGGGVAPAAVSPGGPVEELPTRDHVADGQAVEYNTNPPTSGNHWAQAATWGIYPSRPPADERLVHNLEHGGVIISYNPAKVDAATVEKLTNLARDLRKSRTCLILTPRESIQDDKPIALTSWGFLATLDSYDEAAIRAFWRDHVARGPEFGEGVCG